MTTWIVVFDYREDNGPTHVGPFETKGGAEFWLSKQREYEASVVPLTWHDQWLPTRATPAALPPRIAQEALSPPSPHDHPGTTRTPAHGDAGHPEHPTQQEHASTDAPQGPGELEPVKNSASCACGRLTDLPSGAHWRLEGGTIHRTCYTLSDGKPPKVPPIPGP